MLGALAVGALAAAPAHAADTHEFLPVPSAKLSEGVPVASGAAVTGPLGAVGAMSVDSGRLWVADRSEAQSGGSRVDRFDVSSGEWVAPQLNEEAGLSFLVQGLAVGHPGGEEQVYVGASREPGGVGERVVGVYGPSGKVQSVWTGASTANKSFTNAGGEQVGLLAGVAVDGSENLETRGDVYVATNAFEGHPAFSVVDVLKHPAAGGAEPAETTRILGTCAALGEACPGKEVPFKDPSGVAVSAFNGDVLVTDEHRVVDVFEPAALGTYRFVRQLKGTPTGPLEAESAFERVVAVAVNGATGDVYLADTGRQAVDEFDAAGNYLGQLTGTPEGAFSAPESVAVDPVSGRVSVADHRSETQSTALDVFGANIVVPDVVTGEASGLTPSSATLNGTVDRAKEGAATCQFVWGTTHAFGHVAACEPPQVPEEEGKVPVHANLTGLAPDTTYFFRLQATNHNGTNPGKPVQDHEFTTSGPGLREASVADVAATSATLNARIDPHGAPTSYYFQYGKTSEYGAATPAPPGSSLGAGEGAITVAPRHIQGLTPNTVYHYRVVAVSELEVEGVVKPVVFSSADHTFTTQGATAFALPDGRRWEQVSPVDKHGALIQALGTTTGGNLVQASAAGDRISYRANQATEAGVKGNSESVQVMSSRGAGGWGSQDIALPHSTVVGSHGGASEYRFFTEDLSLSVVEPLGPFTSLAPEAFPPDTERTSYLRHNTTCVSTPATCFEPLATGAPGYADVPEGTKFGAEETPPGSTEKEVGEPKLVGATSDLSHVVLSSKVALTPTTTPPGNTSLYEWSAAKPPAERLQLISLLPDETPATENALLGSEASLNHGGVARHAISDDGSRIVWSAGPSSFSHLYVRDTVLGQTVQLDVPESGAGAGQVNAQFQSASRDGSRVFFTDPQRLTGDSRALPFQPDLYSCDMTVTAGKLECALTDLTHAQPGEAVNVQGGALGVSDDGNTVYFVATGVLTTVENSRHETPEAGAENLYTRHYDTASKTWEAPQFITTLSGNDFPDWGVANGLNVFGQTARVSPNGRFLSFMSERSLTGYDNRDVSSEALDEEVFLYDANKSNVVCASCDPTGARPTGVEYKNLHLVAGGGQIWEPHAWLAANIPAWTASAYEYALYQPRYLSNTGRLFFNSSDALVPQDINKNEDVYQYEPAGEGGCTTGSSMFSEASGGCVGLISSGTASGESAFLDASESGNDVFFLTTGGLSPQDGDGALDVYDAHACTATAPCVSSPASPPACTTSDACRAAPGVQPSIFGSPSSSTFSGNGNLPPGKPAKAKTAAQIRAEQLARALKACRRKHNHQRRTRCERTARKHYGVARPHRASAHKQSKG